MNHATTIQPQSPSQVARELDHLAESVMCLDDTLMDLGGRIACVLADEWKGCEEAGGPPQEALVPLADQIRTIRKRIEAMNRQAQSRVNRIEL